MFQEYIDEVKKNLLQEKGGLGRALGKMGFDPTRADKQYNVCLISANRTENTPEENKKARIAMQRMLRQMGYGFNHTKGGWTEKDKEGNLVTDSEPSFLVTDIYDEPERFLQRMIALGAKFNQTDILVKLKGETEPAKYLTTTHHIDKDDDTGEETTYNIADTERTFTKAKQADIKKDPYWTQIYNKAFKLEGAELEAASQVMTLTEDQVTALYDVPFSKYGRNFSTLPQAHIAYCVLHQDLGLEDCNHSRHPYGEKWTAKAISDAHQNLHEDSLKHTLSQLQDRDDVHVCFITAYTDNKDKKANDEANKELEKDLQGLGYRPKDAYMAGHTKTIGGFKYKDGKIGNEPGYKVAVRNIDPDLFKEDMLALGKKYGQWSILLKLGAEPAAYYHTFPDHPERYGQIDEVFTDIKDANPQDPSTFTKGYTQMRKDKNKHPDRAFQYVQEEDFKLTEEEYNALPEKGLDINSGNWWIHRGCLREKLGLPATHQKD